MAAEAQVQSVGGVGNGGGGGGSGDGGGGGCGAGGGGGCAGGAGDHEVTQSRYAEPRTQPEGAASGQR